MYLKFLKINRKLSQNEPQVLTYYISNTHWLFFACKMWIFFTLSCNNVENPKCTT